MDHPEITNETPKRRTLPEAAKPYRWKKGGPSPNPGGRPKTAHISQALRAVLEGGEADELASVLLALASGRKRGTAVQIAALREIADRTEGKARQTVEVDANLSSSLAERIEAARKQVMRGTASLADGPTSQGGTHICQKEQIRASGTENGDI